MATSKNKRKNGKKVGHNPTKRMRSLASRDLKHLLLCNIVDSDELNGNQRLMPRSLVYDTKLGQPVSVTTLQEVAMKKERWRWEIHFGAICRNPDGEVYIDKELNVLCKQEYLLKELNDYIADTLIGQFEKANSLHRLTMFWVACPIEMERVPLEAVLWPLHQFNILGNMYTAWESENIEQHKVIYQQASDFKSFVVWFMDQRKYINSLNDLRGITLRFEPTGERMKKGELIVFRDMLRKALGSSFDFSPIATVKGFSNFVVDVTCTGREQAVILTTLSEVPACLLGKVEVRYSDGKCGGVTFSYGKKPEICEM